MTAAGLEALFWRLNGPFWRRLPARVRDSYVCKAYGSWANARIRLGTDREMYTGTYFLRNRPALELMRRLSRDKPPGSQLNVAVLGCSIGVEVYSILWVLRSALPDLEIAVSGVDTSAEVIEIAAEGIYAPATSEMVGAQIFERLSEREMRAMFDWEGDTARVKDWLREGIEWRVDDACDPELSSRLGRQDIVVASNFLCHMPAPDAERCLRNIARLAEPGGYMFVSGVDLDVRTKVASALRWKPVEDLLPEIHEGDPSVCGDWPCQWWGLEPFDPRRENWRTRYAAAFRVDGEHVRRPSAPDAASTKH